MIKNKTNILAICQRRIPSAIVGVISLIEYLSGEGLLEFQFKETLRVTREDIANADVLLCIRGSDISELKIVSECRRLGKYVVYFLDDDLLNITEMSNSYQYFKQSSVQEVIKGIFQLCQCLWTTNPNINSKYKNDFERVLLTDAPAILLPLEKDVSERNNSEEIVIGFAGGIDHEFFLDNALREPVSIIQEKYNGRVRFEFVGAKPKFVGELSLDYIPYQSSYEDYISMMHSRNWDIAIAPLPKSEFHSCKYFNKYLEYGAISVAGIYSDVEPYTYIVENEVNGLLTSNTVNGWVDVLSTLIDSPSLRTTIVNNARRQLESKFTVPFIAETLFSQAEDLFQYEAPKCDKRKVKLPRQTNFHAINKGIQLLRTYKLRFPIYLARKVISYIRNRYK